MKEIAEAGEKGRSFNQAIHGVSPKKEEEKVEWGNRDKDNKLPHENKQRTMLQSSILLKISVNLFIQPSIQIG